MFAAQDVDTGDKMKKYPKTEKYDAAWVEQNWMGHNPLWLLEELCQHLDLKSGIKNR